MVCRVCIVLCDLTIERFMIMTSQVNTQKNDEVLVNLGNEVKSFHLEVTNSEHVQGNVYMKCLHIMLVASEQGLLLNRHASDGMKGSLSFTSNDWINPTPKQKTFQYTLLHAALFYNADFNSDTEMPKTLTRADKAAIDHCRYTLAALVKECGANASKAVEITSKTVNRKKVGVLNINTELAPKTGTALRGEEIISKKLPVIAAQMKNKAVKSYVGFKAKGADENSEDVFKGISDVDILKKTAEILVSIEDVTSAPKGIQEQSLVISGLLLALFKAVDAETGKANVERTENLYKTAANA